MSKKRFTDADKWEDPWYRGLPMWAKTLWNYLCDRCDNAGVWARDDERLRFEMGEALDLNAALDIFAGRIRILAGNKWHIIKFIDFQYPTGLNPKSPPQAQVIKLLSRHGIAYPTLTVGHTLSDRVRSTLKDTDKETDKDQDADSNARATPPTTPLPIALTKPGIVELRHIPGLKLTPDSHPAWLDLAAQVGLEVIRQARDEVIFAGKDCWVADMTAAALRIHRAKRKSIVDQHAQERQQSASSERAAVIEAARVAQREEAIAFLAELEQSGRIDKCDKTALHELRKAIAYNNTGMPPIGGPLGPVAKIRKQLDDIGVPSEAG